MIVLGIDPGYAIVGCGVVEYKNNHFRVITYGAITTEAHTPILPQDSLPQPVYFQKT